GRFDLPAGIDEVALPVELADVPGQLSADAVDGTDPAAVGGGRRGLLQLPQVLRQAGDRRRRVDDIFRSIQGERPPAFGEVAVIADVNAELAVAGLEHRPLRRAGLEEELLPESRQLRNV